MIKIIAGKHKNKSIYTPKNLNTRPTSARLKETIFNMLKHSNNIKLNIENINVLDLFAGSGAFGLECISRGCNSCVFIDNNTEAINTINKNIRKLKEEENCKVVKNNAVQPLKNISNINLCFIDPPYKINNLIKVIDNWVSSGCIDEEAIYILEKNSTNNIQLAKRFELLDSRKQGITEIIFFKKL